MFFKYVPKKDARKVLDRQILVSRIAFILWAVALVLIEAITRPQIINIYNDFPLEIPVQVRYSTVIAGILLVIFLIILIALFRKPDYRRIDKVTARYKSGEMIGYLELAELRYFLLILAGGLAVVLFNLVTVMAPLYNLANQL